MSRITFVHAADLHLDTPFEGLGRVAAGIAEHLRDSSLRAWDSLVELCLAENASILLLAGDIYDGEARGVRAQIRFLRGLERLAERGIKVFVAHGNHDPTSGRWSAIRSWPPGVTVFPHERVQSVPVEQDGKLVTVVHGISHGSREVSENLALGFRRGPEPCAHLALLHCNVDGDLDHPLYSPCTLDDLRRAEMDYWALGHIHRHRVLSSGDTWAVYAGALQGRSLQAGERGIKGAVVGTIEDKRVTTSRFVPVPNVRFVELTVDIAGVADLPRLVRQLESAIEAEEASAAALGFVVRARLTGRGPVHSDLRRPGTSDDVQKLLREDAEGRMPFVWWAEVRDETEGELDREAIRRRGDFGTELLLRAEALRADEGMLQRFVAKHTAELATPALQRWARDLPGEAGSLVDAAAIHALERLESLNES